MSDIAKNIPTEANAVGSGQKVHTELRIDESQSDHEPLKIEARIRIVTYMGQ